MISGDTVSASLQPLFLRRNLKYYQKAPKPTVAFSDRPKRCVASNLAYIPVPALFVMVPSYVLPAQTPSCCSNPLSDVVLLQLVPHGSILQVELRDILQPLLPSERGVEGEATAEGGAGAAKIPPFYPGGAGLSVTVAVCERLSNGLVSVGHDWHFCMGGRDQNIVRRSKPTDP